MREPRRLLDEPGEGRLPHSVMHSVLQAGIDMDPPPGAKDAVLRSLELAIAAGAVATTAHVAASASASVSPLSTSSTVTATGKAAVFKLGIVKIIGIACLSTAVIGGAAIAAKLLPRSGDRSAQQGAAPQPFPARDGEVDLPPTSTGAPETRSTIPFAFTTTAVATAAATPEETKPLVKAASAISNGAQAQATLLAHDTGAPTNDASKESKLADESEAFANARAKMRSGDAAGAVKALDDMQTRFGSGGLSQERATLYVEALAACGRTDQARAYADAFIASHPSSVLAERMRPYATPSAQP